jgi:hypothetical protein
MQQLRYDSKQETGSLGNFISMLNIINTEQPLTIIGISKDCVAIYAGNPNLEGASIIVYNIQFKVVQARQFFKIFYNDSLLWTVDNNIFLAVGQQMSVIPFRVSREQLSDMLGSQKTTVAGTYVDMESINEDADYEECLTVDYDKDFTTEQLKSCVLTNGFVEGDEEEMPVKPTMHEKRLSKLEASGKRVAQLPVTPFACPYDVDKSLRSLIKEDMLFEIIYDEHLLPGTVDTKLFSNCDDSLVFSENYEVLANELEKCGASEYEISEKLLNLLIPAQATEDIAVCLRRYTTIPEKALVKTLKFILSLAPIQQQLTTPEKSKKKKNKKLPEEDTIDLLNLALSCSFVATSIIPHLRQEIDMSTALSLCNHLYNIVATDGSDCLYELPENCESFDMDTKACEWLMVLLDSHYQQFVLTKDEEVFASLKDWQKHLNGYLGNLNELRALQAQLDLVVRKKKIDKEKRINKWYSIESVQLY